MRAHAGAHLTDTYKQFGDLMRLVACKLFNYLAEFVNAFENTNFPINFINLNVTFHFVVHSNRPEVHPELDQHHRSQRRTADHLHPDRHVLSRRIRLVPAGHRPGVKWQLFHFRRKNCMLGFARRRTQEPKEVIVKNTQYTFKTHNLFYVHLNKKKTLFLFLWFQKTEIISFLDVTPTKKI